MLRQCYLSSNFFGSADVATLEYVLHLDKERKFVIHELDELNLFIDPSAVDFIFVMSCMLGSNLR